MRVLHVINSLSGSGGAEQGLVREAVRFNRDVDQMVVKLFPQDHLTSELEAKGIPTVSLDLDSSRSGWNWPLGVLRLRDLVSRFRPDVVHSSLTSANLVAQLATRGDPTPVLSTFTLSGDVDLVRKYQPGAAAMRAALLRRISAASARQGHVWFRALTSDSRSTSCRATGVDPSRVKVIPRGVPIPDLSDPIPERAALGLPPDAPLILNVGRQTAQKGHPDLIAALAQVRDTMDAHLVILGREGDGTPALRGAIARHRLNEHVTVVSYSPRPYDYYRVADVFAFPSFMEGLGTALLEAMACGLPVVAYDIPPVREVTRNGELATLVPTGGVSALAKAVAGVIAMSAAQREVIGRARLHIVENFSIDVVAQRVEEHLAKVVELARSQGM